MDFLSSNLFIAYSSLALLVIVVCLRIFNNTKRHNEWLLKSFSLGLGIGPVIILLTNSSDVISKITLSDGVMSWVELAIFSGLVWTVAATGIISLKRLSTISTSVTINWVKVAVFYITILLTLWIGSVTRMNHSVMLVAVFGLASILLAARQRHLLIYSAITGVLFAVVGIFAFYLATFLKPEIGQYELVPTGIQLAYDPVLLLALGMLALASPIVSHWWFNQPLESEVT